MYPKLPPDATIEEKELLFEWDAASLYQRVPGLMDKFIIAMVFELNYSQTVVAMCLGVSDGYVSQRLSRVKKRLQKEYNISNNNGVSYGKSTK